MTDSVRKCRAGMTLIELCLGMILLSLVSAAVASMLVSVSRGWTQQQAIQDAVAGDRQASHQVYELVRRSKRVGLVSSDNQTVDPVTVNDALAVTKLSPGAGARMMIWRNDDNSDNVMQAAEITLIVHSSSDLTLVRYDMPANSILGSLPFDECDIADTGDAEAFALLPGCQGRVLARNVRNIRFSLASAGKDLQRVDFVLDTGTSRTPRDIYGTATVRAGKKPALKSTLAEVVDP